MSEALLTSTLALAVPMWIYRFKRDRLTLEQVLQLAREAAQVVAEKGDVIQFKGKKGESATAFNALARGIAAASFAPGGIKFMGMHFETDPKELAT